MTQISPNICIVPVREVTYEEAKVEIAEFIKSRNNRAYISEIVEELHIDIDLIIEVVENLNEEKKVVCWEKEPDEDGKWNCPECGRIEKFDTCQKCKPINWERE